MDQISRAMANPEGRYNCVIYYAIDESLGINFSHGNSFGQITILPIGQYTYANGQGGYSSGNLGELSQTGTMTVYFDSGPLASKVRRAAFHRSGGELTPITGMTMEMDRIYKNAVHCLKV